MKDVTIICSRCASNSRILTDLLIEGLTESERWDLVSEEIKKDPNGWTVTGNPRFALCESCSKTTEQLENGFIKKYSRWTRCPKCKCGNLDTMYDGGAVSPSLARVPHIVRTCKRCGYKFIQRCCDDDGKRNKKEIDQ